MQNCNNGSRQKLTALEERTPNGKLINIQNQSENSYDIETMFKKKSGMTTAESSQKPESQL